MSKSTRDLNYFINRTINEYDVNTGKIIHQYKFGAFIGKGGFAEVYQVECIDENRVYACKVVTKERLETAAAVEKLKQEISIQKKLDHPNVVKLYRDFEDENYFYLVLELCTNQTLNQLLRRRGKLTEPEVQYFALQIIDALEYLHKNLIIHRDIKLGNVLLDENLNCKIGDFGLATQMKDENDRKKTMCGTPNYIAPEILEGKEFRAYSYEVDTWSFGCVIYTLLIGSPPFETNELKATYKRIKECQFEFPETTKYISVQARHFIRGLINGDPAARLSLQEMREQPFFTDSPMPPPKSLPLSILQTPLAMPAPVQTPPTPKIVKKVPVVSKSMAQPTVRVYSSTTNNNVVATTNNANNIHTHNSPPSPPSLPNNNNYNNNYNNNNPNSATGYNNGVPQQTYSNPSRQDSSPTQGTQLYYQKYNSNEGSNPSGRSNQTESVSHAYMNNNNIINNINDINAKLRKTKSENNIYKYPFLQYSYSVLSISLKDFRKAPWMAQGTENAWIVEYYDYTNSFGIGYLYEDLSVGVFFNDYSTIFFNNHTKQFSYREMVSVTTYTLEDPLPEAVTGTLEDYPKELYKKVSLLKYFRQYLLDLRKAKKESHEPNKVMLRPYIENPPFIIFWYKTDTAHIFLYSNGASQIIFISGTAVLFNPYQNTVVYYDKQCQYSTLSIASACSGHKKDLEHRLNYLKSFFGSVTSDPSIMFSGN